MSASLTLQLDGISLQPIEDARKAITDAIASPEVTKLLSGKPFEVALGSLGGAVAKLKVSAPDAGALLQPIAGAVLSVMGTLDIGALPIGDLTAAVTEGVNRVARLLEALLKGQDLGSILSLERVNRIAADLTRGMSVSGSADIGGLRALIDRAESGFSGDIGKIVEFALDALLPAGGSGVLDLRAKIDAMLAGALQIRLPTGRFGGLIAALDLVAAASSQQQLDAALINLDQVRRATLDVLRVDLRKVRDAIELLRFDQALAPILLATEALRSGETGFLELIERWRVSIAEVRERFDEFDVDRLAAFMEGFTKRLEDAARMQFDTPMDVEIERAVEFVRALFRDLPHRTLRAQLTAFLATAAQAVRDAHLDVVAKEARKVLDEIEAALSPDDLKNEIEGVLMQVRDAAAGVLAPITTALAQIGAGISTVQGELHGVLDDVVAVLKTFSDALANVTASIDGLGIEEAAGEVVATLHDLRAKAEALLSTAPVPEPLRPVVDQVISTLEGIDFDAVLAPVRAAAAQLMIPPEIAAQVEAGLNAVAEKLEMAIPAELISSIDAELKTVLDSIRSFDPAKLAGGVGDYLDDAAKQVEKLDPVAAAAAIAPQFQAVLDAIDSVHPRKLLAPVIEGYNAILSKVQGPGDAGQTIGNFTAAINSAGESVTKQLVAPVAQLTGATAKVGGAPVAGGAAQAIPDDLRAGDAIRLLAWLPKKVREALQALPETAAGQVLATIDQSTTGLARELRALRRNVVDLEMQIDAGLSEELSAVGDSQVRAQLAITVKVPGVQVSASVSAVAAVSPSELRLDLLDAINEVRVAARDAAGSLGGSTAAALDRAASALESCSLGSVTGSLDDFLAALDPEPVAAELDALCDAFIARLPELMTGAGAALQKGVNDIRRIVEELGPAAQAHKIFRVLEVLRDELSVLDPATLADELGAIHAAIRDAVAAYDPALLAKELKDVVTNIAASLRALDPAELLGNLDLFGDVLAAIEDVNPAAALKDAGADLEKVGAQLKALNPRATLELVNDLPQRVLSAFEAAAETIKAELIALLKSIRYASGNANVSVSASAEVDA
jgi:hypothetical protein